MAGRVAAARPRRVLEVACGTGILTAELRAALGDGVQLMATDLNDPMLAHARSKPTAKAIDWQQADGTRLPTPDGSVDVVVCQFGYMFFPDKRAAFREAARVLAPGGRLFFSVWNKLDDNPSGQVLQEAVQALGGADPPTFYRVPFSYADEDVIREDLMQAGLETISFDRLVIDAAMPSPSDVATGLVRGTPMFVALSDRHADVDAIEREVARLLVERSATSPLTLRLDAKIITAGPR
jgi:SAM-dependent methyltransferase